MKMYKIYVSGALTDVENPIETKALYEKIGLVCEEIGFQSYVPHLHTDPVNNPDITPREVFDKDKVYASFLKPNLKTTFDNSPIISSDAISIFTSVS